jgi:hypothetical protein
VLGAFIVAATIGAPWRTAGHYFGSWLSVLGIITPAAYINELTVPPHAPKEHEYVALVSAIAEQTPPEARLMLLFEHRGFYIPRDFRIGTPFFQDAVFTPPESFSDPAQIMEVLSRERMTHVVMAREPLGPDRAGAWYDRFDPLLAGISECAELGKLRAVWQSNLYIMLEVVER